jgi:NTP pyrophosphatase (non-canonical NTP hydrolase)
MSSASSLASSSSSTAALAAVLERWPGGIDLVPASRLDRHAFSTLRAVAIALDGPVGWALLRARYPAEHPVTLLEPDRATTLAEAERDTGGSRFLVLGPLEPFADLASVGTVMRIVERLRAPNGCPWDREQTHASLRPHLLEEAYEALAALDSGDPARLRDELGDLLLQIALHAELAREEGTFNANEVVRRLNEKLIRRHPHVFAGTRVSSGDELLAQWERIKREEQGDEPKSLLGGVPHELPALFAAERMLERAARVKLEPPRLELPLDIDDQDFLGDLLFDIVSAARDAGFDAETALREANGRFAAHVGRVEERAAKDGRALESYAPEEMRRMWEETA